MKKISWVLFFLFTCMFLFSVAAQIRVLADVGNFNDYDSDSSSDSDSYDSSDDWGNDSGDYSSSDSYDTDDDYGSSSSNYSAYGADAVSYNDVRPDYSVYFVVFIGIGIIVLIVGTNHKSGEMIEALKSGTGVGDMTEQIEQKIRKNDPDFSAEKFLAWAKDVFIALQDAWTKRDWKIIRPFESEALFNKHNKQLDEYIRNNTINIVEEISISRAVLTNYILDNDYEFVTVFLKASMHDYIIDANTKQVVKGSKEREFFPSYNLLFMRSLGVKTTANSGKNITNCPNCGAPVKITSSGECEYCNSVITTGMHDWVLIDLDSAG